MSKPIVSPVSGVCPDTGSDSTVVKFPKPALVTPSVTTTPSPPGGRTRVKHVGLILNKTTAKKLGCEIGKTETLHRDSQLPGFILRCYANGRRIWLVQYRDRHGATRRVNIGDAAIIEADVAREKAKDLLAEARGSSPAEKRDEARKAAKLGDAVQQYLTHAASKVKPATLKETRRNLMVHCKGLHSTPVREIGRARLASLHDSLSVKNGKVVANRVLAALSSFFSWAIGRGLVDVNPIMRMPRNAEKSRDRVLTNDELKAIWKATGSGNDFSRIVRLLILTGTRRSEVGGMQWSELQDDLWTIPGERTKNGLPHEIPIARFALQNLPLAQIDPPASQGDFKIGLQSSKFVFGKRATSGFSGWSKAKAELDAKVGFSSWGLHDIRRTFSTRLHDELDVPPHIVEALLNHISGHKGGVSGTYNKALYREQKREALERWSILVGKIVEGE